MFLVFIFSPRLDFGPMDLFHAARHYRTIVSAASASDARMSKLVSMFLVIKIPPLLGFGYAEPGSEPERRGLDSNNKRFLSA
jgi:hypothetical protein